jgi:hypothetical protein
MIRELHSRLVSVLEMLIEGIEQGWIEIKEKE